jgi:glycosyltransferase involved in cell wall biosynthesis
MIVVDTGSEDETPEIARQQGAKVFDFPWCDDFAAARNYAIAQASGEWILTLDADEELIVNSATFRETLAADPEVLVYSVDLLNVGEEDSQVGGKFQRIFRNIPDIRYQGRLHEKLVYQGEKIRDNRRVYLDSLKILHYGYLDPNFTQQKAINRNIPILERMREEEGLNLENLYCLASMCAEFGYPEKSQLYYEELFERLLPYVLEGNKPDEFLRVPTMLHFFASEAFKQEDYETARMFCQRGLEWCPNFPPLNYLAGEILLNLGFALGAIAYFDHCLKLDEQESYYKREPFQVNYMRIYPAYQLGIAYLTLQRLTEAKAAFEKVVSWEPNHPQARKYIEKLSDL